MMVRPPELMVVSSVDIDAPRAGGGVAACD